MTERAEVGRECGACAAPCLKSILDTSARSFFKKRSAHTNTERGFVTSELNERYIKLNVEKNSLKNAINLSAFKLRDTFQRF